MKIYVLYWRETIIIACTSMEDAEAIRNLMTNPAEYLIEETYLTGTARAARA